MFSIATRNFVEEVDSGGLLIPVCSLNDSIAPLTVVVKRRRFWFWQKPKYQPTDFLLNDILESGDTAITPVLVETDFIKYSGTFGDNIQGTVDASFVSAGVNLEGKDSSKLQSSFGSLKKEEVDVQKLLRDCKNRVLDMSHYLIEQTKEKNQRVFGIVKERIVTTQPCSVIEEVQQGGQCGGSLNTCGPKYPKVSLKENGSLSKDTNVTLEIPTNTTIAYGLIELEIKHDGHFKLCLTSDTNGGFEVDGPVKKDLVKVSGAPVHLAENSHLSQELEKLSGQFQLLSALPGSARSSLLQETTKLLQDKAAVSALQHVLDQMHHDKKPDLEEIIATDSQKESMKTILDLLEQLGQVEATAESTSVLTAFHLLTSALEELTNDGLVLLGMCCDPKVLQTLELLVQCASGSGELPLSSAALTQDILEKTKHLFAASNVILEKDGSMLKTEINNQPGNLPLVLCIAIRSLASLAHSV